MTLGKQALLLAVAACHLAGCAETTSCGEEPQYGTVCSVDRDGHDECSDARYPPPQPELVEPDYVRP